MRTYLLQKSCKPILHFSYRQRGTRFFIRHSGNTSTVRCKGKTCRQYIFSLTDPNICGHRWCSNRNEAECTIRLQNKITDTTQHPNIAELFLQLARRMEIHREPLNSSQLKINVNIRQLNNVMTSCFNLMNDSSQLSKNCTSDQNLRFQRFTFFT